MHLTVLWLDVSSLSAAVRFWPATICLWFKKLSIDFTPIWTAYPFLFLIQPALFLIGYWFAAPPRECKTLMMVVGLVWSNESRSYAGGSVATSRASHARLVRDEDPD